MRVIALLIAVAVLAIWGLVEPHIGLYGYVWFSMMRPDLLAWDFQRPYAFLLAVVTLVSSLRYIGRVQELLINPIARTLILLQIPIVLSVLTAAVSRQFCYEPLDLYERVILMAVLTPMLIQTREHLRWMIMIVAFSLGGLGFKFGLWGVLHGGVRFTQGQNGWGFLGDNNGLALAMAMAVPLCWYSRLLVTQKWAKLGFIALAFGSMATVIQTFARGGSLALAAVLLTIIRRSRHKVGALVALTVLLFPVIYLVQDQYFDRMATLKDPSQEHSSASRLEMYRGALAVARDYPLLGVGFGGTNFIIVVQRYLEEENFIVAHNTYLQMMADSGIPAFLIWVGLMWGTTWWLGRSAKRMKVSHPGMEVYPLAIQGALIAFAVGSTFYSRIKFEPYYTVLMCAASWHIVQRRLLAEDAMKEDEGETEVPAAEDPEGNSGDPAAVVEN